MRFQAIQHMEWALSNVQRPKPAANLSISAVEDFPLEEIPWDPALVSTDKHNPPSRKILLEIVAERYGVGPEQVLATSGCTGANFLAAAALVDRGDRVLVEEPVYEPLWRNFETIGAEVVFVPRNEKGDST